MAEKIGIVGGGQLGKMLVIAGKKLGFEIYILDPTPNSPAGQVADKQIVGDFTNPDEINHLAKQVDFLTFETESAGIDMLLKLERQGVKVNPSAKTLKIIRDKYKQKEFLKRFHIPTSEFAELVEALNPEFIKENILHLGDTIFGYPLMLKARFGAYDGKGNMLLKSKKDIDWGLKKLSNRLLYAEKFVPFKKELAVMVVRSTLGEITCYPVVETTHFQNICHTVIVPAPISKEAYDKAKSLAVEVVDKLEGAGVFGVEMFLKENGEVLVNEIAPRVHNSGHYTIEACVTSQFEQHIRAITGMPLGSVEMKVPSAVMINILGGREGLADPVGIEEAEKVYGVKVHIYGKKEVHVSRKMGHITAVGNDPDEVFLRAMEARKHIKI